MDSQYGFLVLTLGLLTFFLVRFWYSVDETRKDVKSILQNQARQDEVIKNLREDVDELREKYHQIPKQYGN